MSSPPINSPDYTHCDLFRQSTLMGQRASALMITITVISLGILFLSHLEPGFFSKHAALLGTLGGVLAGTFVIFVVTTLVKQKDERKTKIKNEKSEMFKFLKGRSNAPAPTPQPLTLPREIGKKPKKTSSIKTISVEAKPSEKMPEPSVKKSTKKKTGTQKTNTTPQASLPSDEGAPHQETQPVGPEEAKATPQKPIKVKKTVKRPPSTDTSSHGSSSEEDELPLDQMMRDLVNPLFDSFEALARAMIVCHGVKNRTITTLEAAEQKEAEVHELVEELKVFVDKMIKKKSLFVSELLALFGPPKQSAHFFFRMLVVAQNSGDPKLIESVEQNYLAAKRGSDLSAVYQWLQKSKKQPSEELAAFPGKLEPHFCLNIKEYKKQGVEILKIIFKKTKDNKTVQEKLLELKKTPYDKEKFPKEVQNFVKTVFKEAKIDSAQLDQWNETLIRNTFKYRLNVAVPWVLKTITLHMGILELMVDQSKKNEELFPELDMVTQTAESSHLFTSNQKDLQRELIKVQSSINYGKKPEDKIALIAIPQTDKEEDYTELAKRYPIVKYAFRDYPGNLPKLKKINDSKAVKELESTYDRRVIAIPVLLPDHLFKTIRLKQNKIPSLFIKFGAQVVSALKPFIPGLVKPKLKKILPNLEDSEQKQLNRIIEGMISLLLHPIVDGAISMHKDFSPIFKKAIITKGKELAKKVEPLANQSTPPSFEEICSVWEKGVAEMAQIFNESASK